MGGDWQGAGWAADAVAAAPDASIDALWRTLNYLVVAQLYLQDNVTLQAPLTRLHLKTSPQGHWGVCPPVNLVLALLAPARRVDPARLSVVHGAGHAGPSALAYAYLTGELGQRLPDFLQSAAGLTRLVAQFPHAPGLGGEITPLIPGQLYMGGQLGPSLAVATGLVLDRPKQLAVALMGDGECETGAAAAAWLGRRAFTDTGHGAVLPVVLLNGLRMGDRSLLSLLSAEERDAYFLGMGYRPYLIDGAHVGAARAQLARALRTVRSVSDPEPTPVLIVTVPKGATGPEKVAGRQVLGTPAVHKAPLIDPARRDAEWEALRRWLASYRPSELLDRDGRPSAVVAAILPSPPPPTQVSRPAHRRVQVEPVTTDFARAVTAVVRRHLDRGRFRVFSPDELASNRLAVLTASPAVTEVLNEELCHAWLQGYLAGGGNGLLISYEAFATINLSLVLQHLLTAAVTPGPRTASLNYLLTSVGWRNTYSHQGPVFAAALVETEMPSVRVYTPADAGRVAATLDRMLTSRGRTNVLIADKRHRTGYPGGPLPQELARGVAIWSDFSDSGPPALVLAAAGDVAMRQALATRDLLRAAGAPAVRVVAVGELTALGHPSERPHALSAVEFTAIFGTSCPVLVLTGGYAGPVRGLLATRPDAWRFTVRGFRHPPGPMQPDGLLHYSGIDAPTLAALARDMVATTAAPEAEIRKVR